MKEKGYLEKMIVHYYSSNVVQVLKQLLRCVQPVDDWFISVDVFDYIMSQFDPKNEEVFF